MTAALGEFAAGNIKIQRADLDGYEWVFDKRAGTLFICGSDFDVIPTVLDALNDPDAQQIISRRLGGTCRPELKALPGGGKTTKRRAKLSAVR